MPTEEGMDKYGVDEEQEEQEKFATTGCPQCGATASELRKYGALLICPRCGSEPFEKRR